MVLRKIVVCFAVDELAGKVKIFAFNQGRISLMFAKIPLANHAAQRKRREKFHAPVNQFAACRWPEISGSRIGKYPSRSFEPDLSQIRGKRIQLVNELAEREHKPVVRGVRQESSLKSISAEKVVPESIERDPFRFCGVVKLQLGAVAHVGQIVVLPVGATAIIARTGERRRVVGHIVHKHVVIAVCFEIGCRGAVPAGPLHNVVENVLFERAVEIKRVAQRLDVPDPPVVMPALRVVRNIVVGVNRTALPAFDAAVIVHSLQRMRHFVVVHQSADERNRGVCPVGFSPEKIEAVAPGVFDDVSRNFANRQVSGNGRDRTVPAPQMAGAVFKNFVPENGNFIRAVQQNGKIVHEIHFIIRNNQVFAVPIGQNSTVQVLKFAIFDDNIGAVIEFDGRHSVVSSITHLVVGGEAKDQSADFDVAFS